MKSYILYDTETGAVRDYPRADNEPVVGLDPRHVVLRIVQEPAPAFDSSTEWLQITRIPDLEAAEYRCGYVVRSYEPEPEQELPDLLPPAESLGQTWTDENGVEWVVVQARNELGQFVADDPDTVENEFLTWERMS